MSRVCDKAKDQGYPHELWTARVLARHPRENAPVAGHACLANLACRPSPAFTRTFARDHEYKRHGTVSLLAGIDLLMGKVHALVRDRHRSREFTEFLKLLDVAYPASTAVKTDSR